MLQSCAYANRANRPTTPRRAERDRLDAPIKALTGVSGAAPARPSGGRKKTMSAAARRRISIAQKARWAKVKAGKK